MFNIIKNQVGHQNQVCHDKTRITSRNRCAVPKCEEKLITRQERRRSSQEHRYSSQMTESDFLYIPHREKIDKKTFKHRRSIIILVMHRAINNNTCKRSNDQQ